VQETFAATPRQPKKHSLNPKSNRRRSQSCGAVETTTPTQRQNNPEPTHCKHNQPQYKALKKKCKRQFCRQILLKKQKTNQTKNKVKHKKTQQQTNNKNFKKGSFETHFPSYTLL